MAKYVLDTGETVFGAAFDSDFNVCHIGIDNDKELYKLQSSKYVQSYIGNTYKQAKKLLDEGKMVLFTGTPCQINGFASFLGKKYDNLILQDIICHGVPSPAVWEHYRNLRQKKSRSPIKDISFRNKRNGWKDYSVLFEYDNKSEYISSVNMDLFMKGYLENIYLRPSCYSCRSKGNNRVSDITLADFWGIENILPDMADGMGTSLVWIHTEKGKEIFDIIKDKITFEKVNISDALKYNKSAYECATMSPNRKFFYENWGKISFDKLIYKNTGQTLKNRIKTRIKILLKRG